jgi:hypothetical protein
MLQAVTYVVSLHEQILASDFQDVLDKLHLSCACCNVEARPALLLVYANGIYEQLLVWI